MGPGFTLTDNHLGSDVVTFTYTAVFASKNVATPQTINVTGIAIGGGADAGNYTLANTSVNGSANIAQRALTVTGTTGGGKNYDGTTLVGAGFALTDNHLGSDVVSFTSTAVFASKNAATPQTINVTGIAIGGGADAGNYTLANTTVTGSANITKRQITITTDPKSKVFGVSDPPLTYQLTGSSHRATASPVRSHVWAVRASAHMPLRRAR